MAFSGRLQKSTADWKGGRVCTDYQEEDGFPDQFFFDVRPSLKRVRVEGMYLDEQELFDLRRSLETIRDIVRFLHRNEDEEGNDTPLIPHNDWQEIS